MYRTIVRSFLMPVVLTSVPRCIAYSDCEKEKGLLEGIPDVGNAKDYSGKINLKDASNSLENQHYLYNSAIKDVDGDTKEFKKYLQDVVQKSKAYMNGEEIWDREELQNTLN
jgi:hypothetical protein